MRRKQFEALVWVLIAVALFIGGCILQLDDTLPADIAAVVLIVVATYIAGGVISGEDERWLD